MYVNQMLVRVYSGLLYKEYNSYNYFTQRHVYFMYDILRIYYTM